MRAAQPVTIHRQGAPLLDANGAPLLDEYGNPRYSDPTDLSSRAIRISPVWGEEISIDGQTHIVGYRGAWPPGGELPVPTDEITFSLSGYRPVRCRVLTVMAVPCRNRNAIKYLRVDLSAIE